MDEKEKPESKEEEMKPQSFDDLLSDPAIKTEYETRLAAAIEKAKADFAKAPGEEMPETTNEVQAKKKLKSNDPIIQEILAKLEDLEISTKKSQLESQAKAAGIPEKLYPVVSSPEQIEILAAFLKENAPSMVPKTIGTDVQRPKQEDDGKPTAEMRTIAEKMGIPIEKYMESKKMLGIN